MSSLEWRRLYQMIQRAARFLPKPKRKPLYDDTLIVAMFFWAVQHDRPQVWACERRNYQRPFLPRRLPSISRFNRRIRSPRCQEILKRVEETSRAPATPCSKQRLPPRQC